MENKLVIGTANFGMTYGQGIHAEKLSEKASKEIIESAKCHGIQTLDTAISYDDCSQRLGNIGVKEWKIITKIPQIPYDISNVFEWVEHSICKSIKEIGISSFEGILIHNPKDITGVNGEKLLKSLHNLKMRGFTRKIGVSVYEKSEIKDVLNFFKPDIIQCPVNILDTRLLSGNYLLKLSKMGIDIHIRSIFLQGILTFPQNEMPYQFKNYQNEWLNWIYWLRSKELKPVEACVRFVNSIQGVNKILIGVNSLLQFNEILGYYQKSSINTHPEWNYNLKNKLLDPRKWNKDPK